MTLNSVLLRLIARSGHSLVSFITALDAKLDTFLAAHDAEVEALYEKVGNMVDDAEAEVIRIRTEANSAVQAVHADISAVTNTAAVLKKLKAGLSA
jgi:hypothetical protein